MNYLKAALVGGSLLLAQGGSAQSLPGGALHESPRLPSTAKTFGVKLGATRLIYTPDSSGATLTVINPQDFPILVQSQVYTEDKQGKAPFIVTPPLFRLDGLQQSRVRIVSTGTAFPEDKEALYWLCVTGVPPNAASEGNSGTVNNATLDIRVRVNNCIKLMVRPTALAGQAEHIGDSITWSREGGMLKASNATPFFVHFREINVGSSSVLGVNYLPPNGTQEWEYPAGAFGTVRWKVITDYGGDSREYQATLQ